jgi:hypothetical protein
MRCRGAIKVTGYSWITIRDRRHGFVSGDRSHPMTEEIYKKARTVGNKFNGVWLCS